MPSPSVHARHPSRRFIRFASALLVALAAAALPAPSSTAQSPPANWEDAARALGLSREEAMRLYQQQVQGQPAAPDTSAVQAAPSTVQAQPGRTTLPDTTAIVILPLDSERRLRAKADSVHADTTMVPSGPQLFGRDFFRLGAALFAPSSFGPVPDDYILGLGDEVAVEAWGDVEFRLERIVDRDGTITLPKGGRVMAAGQTIRSLERQVRDRLAASYSGIDTGRDEAGTTHINVSLGRLRAFRVYVIGDVTQPGAYDMTSAASMFTALYASGGPSENGSMRDIRLVRDGRIAGTLDVYAFLLGGDRSGDHLLRENDAIFVPPRGRTVQLAGGVRREMMFELRPGETIGDLLRFGGGFTAEANRERVHVNRIVPAAERRPGSADRVLVDVALDPATGAPVDAAAAALLDGDVVLVNRIQDRVTGWVEVTGAVKYPGQYQLADNPDLATLLRHAGDAWPEALEERVIIDREAPNGTYEAINVPLAPVLQGGAASVPLMSRDHVTVLSRWDLKDRGEVHISGEVRAPGSFPFREGMTLRDLVLRAGGFKESADPLRVDVERFHPDSVRLTGVPSGDGKGRGTGPRTQVVELMHVELDDTFLTSEASFPLQPNDRVAVRQLPWWSNQGTVSIIGEVRYPGVYTLSRNDETISDLIRRAQGLKETAFAPAARVVRARDNIGNIAIDLECALRKPHDECDLLLVQNDEILIPARSQTVKVVGAVGYQTSIPYADGERIGYYVNRAGGFAENADKGKTRVVYPNGLARQASRFRRDPEVMAGSTVVVPPKPFKEKEDHWDSIERITAILASMATTYLVIRQVN